MWLLLIAVVAAIVGLVLLLVWLVRRLVPSVAEGFDAEVASQMLGVVAALFAAMYVLAAAIYLCVMALATGRRAVAFKAVSPGLLPPIGSGTRHRGRRRTARLRRCRASGPSRCKRQAPTCVGCRIVLGLGRASQNGGDPRRPDAGVRRLGRSRRVSRAGAARHTGMPAGAVATRGALQEHRAVSRDARQGRVRPLRPSARTSGCRRGGRRAGARRSSGVRALRR